VCLECISLKYKTRLATQNRRQSVTNIISKILGPISDNCFSQTRSKFGKSKATFRAVDRLWKSKIIEGQQNRTSDQPDMTNKVDLAWGHSKKVRWQHCQASTPVDATWLLRKRTTKNTWKRDMEKEIRSTGYKYSCRKMETAAQNRVEDEERSGPQASVKNVKGH